MHMKRYLNKYKLYAYQPLVSGGIPGLDNTATLADYVNVLFKIALMVGVVLSVLIIAYSGFEYMTMDVATKKGMAKRRIAHAIGGLLMLLGTYLVMYQINPDIVKIKF